LIFGGDLAGRAEKIDPVLQTIADQPGGNRQRHDTDKDDLNAAAFLKAFQMLTPLRK